MYDRSKEVIIKPAEGVLEVINLKEVLRRLDLVFAFALRDIKVRYRRTLIGIGWAILQPFTQMVIFSFIFGKFAKIPSEGIPYPIFVYSALVPWQLFSRTLSDVSMSILNNSNIIGKIYFPRIIIPISVLISACFDFFISLSILFVLMLIYGYPISSNVFFFPVFMLVQLLCSLGVGLSLSAINVKFRDVKYTLPFLNQIWLFATPVIYPTRIIPEKFQFIIAFNPMTAVIEGWRWCLLGTKFPSISVFAISLFVILVLFLVGLYLFFKMEKEFADII